METCENYSTYCTKVIALNIIDKSKPTVMIFSLLTANCKT